MITTLCAVATTIMVSGGPLPAPPDASLADDKPFSQPRLSLFERGAVDATAYRLADADDPAAPLQSATKGLRKPGPAARLVNALTPSWLTQSGPTPQALTATSFVGSGSVYPMRVLFCDEKGVVDNRVIDCKATVVPIPLASPR